MMQWSVGSFVARRWRSPVPSSAPGWIFRPLVGFPEGQRVADHEDLVDSFEEAAEAIVAEVRARG